MTALEIRFRRLQDRVEVLETMYLDKSEAEPVAPKLTITRPQVEEIAKLLGTPGACGHLADVLLGVLGADKIEIPNHRGVPIVSRLSPAEVTS